VGGCPVKKTPKEFNMLAEFVWNTGTIFWICVFSVPVAGIVMDAWAKIERNRSDNDLKRSMVERGMSPEDIERVIAAKPPKR
jgi:hypothetical protein